ncbi:hypothetical protein POM88_038318 [Heracleum sosnowskyi]|uniref:Uncharacterized protein n=1 Tax=Heracleum sosnowskyi TaxID=360622 RepID=A0AAD8HAT8_9APIA|nr:hypothetical protein POM88_038318 [Heracleum sosnowskyi]
MWVVEKKCCSNLVSVVENVDWKVGLLRLSWRIGMLFMGELNDNLFSQRIWFKFGQFSWMMMILFRYLSVLVVTQFSSLYYKIVLSPTIQTCILTVSTVRSLQAQIWVGRVIFSSRSYCYYGSGWLICTSVFCKLACVG